MSHPRGRPEKMEFVPLTNSVQSPPLSSSHRPSPFSFTIRLTFGNATFVGLLGLITGLKLVPSFGAGFCPPRGPVGKFTTLGWGTAVKGPTPELRMVDRLPDSKIAA